MDKDQLNEIIEKCKKGDKQAFRYIVLEFSDYIFALAFRVLCNEEDARDIVQETFIRVWNNIEKYKPEIKITTWMYKITSNLCLDKIKLNRRKPILAVIENEKTFNSIIDENTEFNIDNQQLAQILNKLIDQLSPKQKLVIILKDIEGLENEEIEQITGMNKTQIKSNLYYARQHIKNSLTLENYGLR
jgi:RNA polymerase sigma-70 factor, ECF subfamily